MARLEIAPGESLYYEYDEPGGPGARAMTGFSGSTPMWPNSRRASPRRARSSTPTPAT